MAGGNGLNIQMGLRKSVDFDFFVPHTFDTSFLYEKLSALDYNIKIINRRVIIKIWKSY